MGWESGSGILIENSNFQRKIIIKFLKVEGCEIAEAPNGKVGLEMVAEHKPEIIFTDLVMPENVGDSNCSIIFAKAHFSVENLEVNGEIILVFSVGSLEVLIDAIESFGNNLE